MARNVGRPPSAGAAQDEGTQKAPERRLRAALGLHSLAGQVFVLQVVIVLLLVAVALVEQVAQSRHDSTSEARNRSLAVAETFAHAPGVVAALHAPNPTAVLQPQTEAARKAAGVDFIVITDVHGIRFTHPRPDRIGKVFVGNTGPPLHGHAITETVNGTIGRLVQAVVPIENSGHKVVGLSSAGITVKKISGVTNRQIPYLAAGGVLALGLSTGGTALVTRRLRRQTHNLGPYEMARMYKHHDAVLHAVREGVVIVGEDKRLLLVNDEARRLLGLPADAEGRPVTEAGLGDPLTAVLAAGDPVSDRVFAAGDRVLVLNLRPTDRDGGPPGSVATLRDSTELSSLSGIVDRARGRLRLVHEASLAIGTTLDVRRSAEELAALGARNFADLVTVDLVDGVMAGDEPEPGSTWVHRVAADGGREAPVHAVGDTFAYQPATPAARSLASGRALLVRDLGTETGWRTQDPDRAEKILAYGLRSMASVPLRARGVTLGVAIFWRAGRQAAFEHDDVSVAEEIAAHAALCIDNARRYTRDHSMAVTLQRNLLPRGVPRQDAVDVAYRYLPAQAGVGGDFFDVIPLPGARVALVVGDVVGHGLHAAATMGRLRTAVHNFSALDLPPDELLGHLDEWVERTDLQDEAPDRGQPITGATCLYVVYDSVSGTATAATAGHLPPAVVDPDGTVTFLRPPVAPPLGLGAGLPVETAAVTLPEGSRLVLYTDGLVEDRHRDMDRSLDLLGAALSGPARTPEDTCTAATEALLPTRPSDDVALLVAATHRLAPDRVAEWDVPQDPAAVAPLREACSRQLERWGLAELSFATELILSELLTNAIRYGAEPIHVRLLRDRDLVCEISDGSSTSPHIRRAGATEEGGRGLYLVASFAERWGTRYSPRGKTIWSAQAIPKGAEGSG
ncbi:SpoIIE family protein phosphatase [Actinacidiphila acidipaludis]|uniref:SpoIIE family protein phosphatase n=1 Tax=Actinacidiphila acidipaludis TaxID=2873382 RepID=A0ABS7Q019_9ACTN|nr:SpoIIE family protein phosphatase [Streptomyces acidipaludis]MBY8876333.1 SpoIIE family protein phosphatase [Streptomyces acidipaludis]